MNVELLRKVKEYILAEPRRLDMNTLGQNISEESRKDKTSPPCGTVGCIAGWAALLNEPEIPSLVNRPAYMDWNRGQDALELNYSQSQRLFTEPKNASDAPGRYWPVDLAKKYVAAKTARQRAKVTAQRIDRFIESNGTE